MWLLKLSSIFLGSVPIRVSEACRLRDAVAKLIKNLTLYYYSSFFFHRNRMMKRALLRSNPPATMLTPYWIQRDNRSVQPMGGSTVSRRAIPLRKPNR